MTIPTVMMVHSETIDILACLPGQECQCLDRVHGRFRWSQTVSESDGILSTVSLRSR